MASPTDLAVRVTPRAGRPGVAGVRNGVLLIKIAAAPVDGAANAELIEILASALHVAKRDVTIVGGERSRNKRVRVAGVDAATAIARLTV